MPYQDAQADVQADDEVRLHRTAIGQVLAFTLQALAIEPPTQKWHDVAHDQLINWKVKYLDVFCSSSNIVNCPHHFIELNYGIRPGPAVIMGEFFSDVFAG
ncbi:hypothetical protein CBS147353_11541 [Aspergillus niger]|nr:hypothetical protein CBS147353_11541 [Aspergillus niger]